MNKIIGIALGISLGFNLFLSATVYSTINHLRAVKWDLAQCKESLKSDLLTDGWNYLWKVDKF